MSHDKHLSYKISFYSMNCLKDNRQHQWNNAKFIVDKNVSLKPMLNQTIPWM